MDARPLTLREVFGQDQQLRVPLFQRPYVWSREKNWQPLWTDIQNVLTSFAHDDAVSPHFMGAVVLDQIRTPAGAMPARQVVDGQQRLTTLQVLLAAVRDSLGALGVADRYVRALGRLTANEDDMSDDPNAAFKVWPTLVDRAPFRLVMTAGDRDTVEEHTPRGAEQPTLVQVYRFFCDEVSAWARQLGSAEQLDEACDGLVRVLRDKLQLVVIDLGPGDNAQVIFESLNDRGTPLLACDLVKNLLFQLAEDRRLPAERLYSDYWKPFETQNWRSHIRQGRLNRPRLDAYLHQYLTMRMVKEVPVPLLFTTFRRFASSIDDLESLMADLARHGTIFQVISGIIRPSSREGLFLRRLDTIDTSVVTPVLLHLFGSYDEKTRWPALEALESWLLRRMVCRQTAKNYNRLLLDLLDELTKAHGAPGEVVTDFLLQQSADSAFWPRDDDIRAVFLSQPLYRQFTQTRLRAVLEGCDRALQTGYGERLTVNETLSIEHLLPQVWETHWPVLADDENGDIMERHRREALKHTLGNLTLVTKKLNPAMSNAGWEKKRADLLQHSALALNRLLATVWGPDQILQRSLELTDAFVTEWPRPPGGVATPSVEEMLGAAIHDDIAEERGTPGAGLRRRSVALHIIEAFRGLPVGTVLTVSEICAAQTSQYGAKEISPAQSLIASTPTTSPASGQSAVRLRSPPRRSVTRSRR